VTNISDPAHIRARIGDRILPREIDRRSFGTFSLTILLSIALLSFAVEPLVMAALGATLMLAGVTLAGIAWLRKTPVGDNVGSWDIAGLLVFLGFAAATVCGRVALLA